MISVLVVDDQDVVRDGLVVILGAADDITVVGEAATGAEAVSAVRRLLPDVVLMDIRMPHMDGIEATKRILEGEEPLPRILILSTFGQDDYVYESLNAGACGFLLKDATRVQLLDGVRAAAEGDRLLAPAITRRLIESYVSRRPRPDGIPAEFSGLTERELEVAGLVANGFSNSEIAEALFVSAGTVKTHVAHVLQKMSLRDRIQLVVLAYECGLVAPGRDAPPGHSKN
jgi:DNA-binding NarL/FixJ family response regulator